MTIGSNRFGVVEDGLIIDGQIEDITQIKAVFLAEIPKDMWKVRARQRALRELWISKRQEESFSSKVECLSWS